MVTVAIPILLLVCFVTISVLVFVNEITKDVDPRILPCFIIGVAGTIFGMMMLLLTLGIQKLFGL